MKKILSLILLLSSTSFAEDPLEAPTESDLDFWQQMAAEGFDEEGDMDQRPGRHRVTGDECDDGNDRPGDGCSEGKVEEGFICIGDLVRCYHPMPLTPTTKDSPIRLKPKSEGDRLIFTGESFETAVAPQIAEKIETPATNNDPSIKKDQPKAQGKDNSKKKPEPPEQSPKKTAYFEIDLTENQLLEVSQHGVLETELRLIDPSKNKTLLKKTEWGYRAKPLRLTLKKAQKILIEMTAVSKDPDLAYDLRISTRPPPLSKKNTKKK